MALSLQLGYPDIPKSITNPNVKAQDALDSLDPLSFLTFIKIITVSFEPDSLQNYYNYYLKSWNYIKNNKESDESNIIINKYRDFLKELSLNYTTLEEKKFLSKIDFNDPLDLDIVLNFYGRKLIELSKFYNHKRNDVKYNTLRNKLKGTNYGTNKTITELTLSYLKNVGGGKIIYDYESIKNNLEIEIEELYDSYQLYYNQSPDEKLYDNKDLDYGYDIFLKSNSEIITEVFAGFSKELINLKEIDDLLDNKRGLTEKYIATDFYYLSTGDNLSKLVSGKLFDADNKVLNFLNREYPTTASTSQLDYLKGARSQGFFTPSKNSIILIDGKNSSYSFNLENLETNKVYYFPDPNLYGTNGDILTFTVDESFIKKNYSSGNAVNKPISTPNDTKYYGYVSKIDQNRVKYLENVFDLGYVDDIKYDIYGNLFGLFKDDINYRGNVEFIDKSKIYNVLINGYTFYDDLYNEGYSFSYLPETTYDDTTYNETIRTGLSTNTSNFLHRADPEITFFGGFFTPYNELITPSEFPTVYNIYDNAYILDNSGNPLIETISSDLSSFETDYGVYYYTKLLESGITSSNPLQRALLDNTNPSLTARLVNYPKLSTIGLVDGGQFIEYDFDIAISSDNYDLIPTTNNPTTLIQSNSAIVPTLTGTIFVKNSITKSTDSLLNTFPYFSSKYSHDILQQLDNDVIRFEIANDVIFIETDNYFIVDKISMSSGNIVDPKSESVVIEHSNDYFDKLSNRFKIGNDVFYIKSRTITEEVSGNNFQIYPEIWKFDLVNFQNSKIFPLNLSDVTDFFNVSGNNVKPTSLDSPVFTYNSRNNLFNFSFLLKDQNNYPRLHTYIFKIYPNVQFYTHKLTKFSDDNVSNDFYNTETLQVFLSSTSPTFESELII